MPLTHSARVNGETNKLLPEDRPVHDWYRFVLSFPPHLVRDYVERFGLGSKSCVLDPFCGTGTTLVECKKLGIPSVGVEANPMAHFASVVKVDWTPNPTDLVDHARRVAEATERQLEKDCIPDNYCPLFLAPEKRRKTETDQRNYRRLDPERQSLLLHNSISPIPLHKTLVLLEKLQQGHDQRGYRHELLALAKTIVYIASNLHFGPEVGVGRPKVDCPVVAPWLAEVQGISDDLRRLQGRVDAPTRVYHGDARKLVDLLEPYSVDAVITSPPYPNEKDYTRTTRLESVLLGFIRSKADLRNLKRSMVRSNTRGVYKHDDDDRWISGHKEVQRIAREIEARRLELGKTSGFERLYARVTKLYFGGMARHLAELRDVLRPGAHLAYVVGDQASYLRIMIRTGHILADVAESLGYKVEAIDLFRTRLATATKEQLREEVVVLRWPGQKKTASKTQSRTTGMHE